MTEERTGASVVVCAYTERRWDVLCASLAAAARQLDGGDQLMLVIDHNEALLERARAELHGVDIVDNTRSRGLSGARNTALEKVTGDIVVFLDDDAVPRDGWLAALRAPYRDDDVFAVGGWASPAWPDGGRPDRIPPELDWVVGCSYEGMPRSRSPIRNLMGCNMSFRSHVFDLVGGFDEGVGRVGTTPLGCEETELCIRLRQERPDVEIIFEPDAIVDHSVTVDRTTWRYLRKRAYAEGISKALISGDVGRDAMTTEVAYGRKVLPAAVVRDTRSWLGGDRSAAQSVGAIPLTLGMFAAGYAVGRLRKTKAAAGEFSPIHVGEVDVSSLDADIDVPELSQSRYREARLVVRDSGRVLGTVDVPVDAGKVRAQAVRDAVDSALGTDRSPEVAADDTDLTASVVIATAGRAAQAERCIASILLGARVPDEIVLVDNAPHLGRNAEALRELADTHDIVRYASEPRPGASAARNLGAAAATTDIVAFTDDDVVVDRWWLHNLLTEFGDSRVGMVTGLVAPHVLDTPAQVWFEGIGGFGKGFDRRRFSREDTEIHPLFPYTPGMVGSGNNMACRRRVWTELGGMSTALGPGTATRSGEDLDLFLRYLLAGGAITYTPHALVWHEHRRDEVDLVDQVRGYGIGLSAMLTRLVVDEPREIGPVLRRIGPGLHRLVGASRQKSVATSASPPKSLHRAELAGFVRGPLALHRSRKTAA
jgi:GT2 family glycosyltransferase